MYSMWDLFKDTSSLSVVHPGIVKTNLITHFPKWINWFIKLGMKIVFASPKKASRIFIKGLNESTNKNEWIGPRIFNIWGKPKTQRVRKVKENEYNQIIELVNKLD